MEEKISDKEKMLDTLRGTLFQELTAIGVDFIRKNTSTAVETVINKVSDVFTAIKDSNKSELKVNSMIRDLHDKSMAEGCELGYQAGRQQKMQMMLYGMSQAGLHLDQVKQIFAATKEAEEQFGDSYDTYEHYLVTLEEIKHGK